MTVRQQFLAWFALVAVAEAFIFASPWFTRLALLVPGDDPMTYESYARDIQLNGLLLKSVEGPFYYQVFYPYFLAAIHTLFGEGMFGLVFVQRALVAFVVWMVVRICGGNRRRARVAGRLRQCGARRLCQVRAAGGVALDRVAVHSASRRVDAAADSRVPAAFHRSRRRGGPGRRIRRADAIDRAARVGRGRSGVVAGLEGHRRSGWRSARRCSRARARCSRSSRCGTGSSCTTSSRCRPSSRSRCSAATSCHPASGSISPAGARCTIASASTRSHGRSWSTRSARLAPSRPISDGRVCSRWDSTNRTRRAGDTRWCSSACPWEA